MEVHHIGYLVKRLADSRDAFAALGFDVVRPVEYDPIRDVNIEFIANGGYCVELIEPASAESPLMPLLKKFKNAPYHLCFIAEDLEKAKEEFENKGYMLFRDIEPAPCLDGRRVVFMVNPDIGIIEIADKEPL